MFNVVLEVLTHSCPLPADLAGDHRCLPSRWLTCGFAPKHHEDGSVTWQQLAVHEMATGDDHGLDAQAVDTYFRRPSAGALVKRLAVTFEPFFRLSRQEWETDLKATVNPVTALHLWETVADVFDYYTQDKHFSKRALQEYFDTLWLFFNHGSEAAGYPRRTLRSLQPARVKKIADELQRYFQRRRRPLP